MVLHPSAGCPISSVAGCLPMSRMVSTCLETPSTVSPSPPASAPCGWPCGARRRPDAGSQTGRRLLRGLVSVALLAGAGVVLSGRTHAVSGSIHSLEHLRWQWLAAAIAVEGASITAFAAVQRRLLSAGQVDVAMAPLAGITLASYSMQNSIPGGVVLAGVFSFRQFHRRGADDVLAGWTPLAATLLSELALVVLTAVGLGVAHGAASPMQLVGVSLGVAVLAGAAATAWWRRDRLLGRLVSPLRLAHRVCGWPREDAGVAVERLCQRMGAVAPAPSDWLSSAAWAAANWVFDAACLAMAFLAVGAKVPWRILPLAYGVTQLAASVPITPGGLGIVEGGLTIVLVAAGGAQANTIAAVLVYRLISYWSLLPLGWLSWAVLRRTACRARSVALGLPAI
jgi:uncharacterized membrane protein YbhN (UPF0104 family)